VVKTAIGSLGQICRDLFSACVTCLLGKPLYGRVSLLQRLGPLIGQLHILIVMAVGAASRMAGHGLSGHRNIVTIDTGDPLEVWVGLDLKLACLSAHGLGLDFVAGRTFSALGTVRQVLCCMAFLAGKSLMDRVEGESGVAIVVEQQVLTFPSFGLMAGGADSIQLAQVDILMAPPAGIRLPLIVCCLGVGITLGVVSIFRMAFGTGNERVLAGQGKTCGLVRCHIHPAHPFMPFGIASQMAAFTAGLPGRVMRTRMALFAGLPRDFVEGQRARCSVCHGCLCSRAVRMGVAPDTVCFRMHSLQYEDILVVKGRGRIESGLIVTFQASFL